MHELPVACEAWAIGLPGVPRQEPAKAQDEPFPTRGSWPVCQLWQRQACPGNQELRSMFLLDQREDCQGFRKGQGFRGLLILQEVPRG